MASYVYRSQKEGGSKRLTIFGVFATFAYLAFIVWYWSDQSSSLTELDPNEFGDFLAGVFAPLAFLWLVLGFLQQGMELRNSADALWLQGEELRNSVEQQRNLVAVTQEQLSLERETLHQQRKEIERGSQPIFELLQTSSVSNGPEERSFDFMISNHGSPCTDVRVSWGDGYNLIRLGALDRGSSNSFRIKMILDLIKDFQVTISYIDVRSNSKSQILMVKKRQSEFEIMRQNIFYDWQ